jgi:hypothetical protein
MKRGLIVIVSVVVLAGAAAALAQALLAEQPVFATTRNERNPAADHNGTTEVWALTRSRSGQPGKYDAFVKEGAGPLVKLNAAGQGWTGGIDYPFVVYQQIASNRSNLFFYDIGTKLRTPATDANSRRWEWHPTFQGAPDDYEMLFNRDANSNPTQRVVYLRHRDSPFIHDQRILATITRATHFLQSDQIAGDWATYTRCVPNCNVRLYRISTHARTAMPKPVTTRPRQQYAGAVTSTGAVYLIRSGPNCGERVRIVRYDPARSDPQFGTIVAALPRGIDVAISHARENTDGSVDVFYDRVNCSTGRFNINKITDPPPGP